jgi:hypothetical protein
MTPKTILTSLREHREAAAYRRRLQQQLFVYASPAEIDDMLASLDGQDSLDADLMRDILFEKLAIHHRRTLHTRAPLCA